MELISCPNYEKLSYCCASYILTYRTLRLGLASGFSPKKTYEYLVKNINSKQASSISGFQIDEYLNCSPTNKDSFNYYLNKNLIKPLKSSKILTIDGKTDNSDKACSIYLEKIKSMSYAKIMILGLGENGHIAFNEPGSKNSDSVRIVKLEHKTKYEYGFTIGIKEILKSKEILLLVTGKNKKMIFEAFLKEKETCKIPATFLKNHKNLKVYIDEEIYLT